MSGSRLVLDAGPLVAFLDRSESAHGDVVQMFENVRPPFLLCEPVLTETCFLLQRLPRAIERIRAWLEIGYLQPTFQVKDHAERIFTLMHKYRNLPMSLADACQVCMIEEGYGDRVFTLDAHFRIYRLSKRRVVPVFMP